MTTPAIEIVDEKPGSASTIDALLSSSAPDDSIPQPAPRAAARLEANSGDLARVQQLIDRWKLDDIATLEERARESGRSLIDEAKAAARSAQASAAATSKNKNVAETKRAGKATGKGFSGVRNVQTAQSLLAKQDADIRELRTELEAAKLANAARDARAEVLSSSEGVDQLTDGFTALLSFLFDSVSELRRMHFEQRAQRQGRTLDADETRAVNGWQITDARAKAIAYPFAQYFAKRMGPDVLELLPLLIGIAGIGGHILHGVQAERLANAERTDVRIVR